MKAAARARGEDIIDFGMGNPDQATPAHIVEKLIEARDFKNTPSQDAEAVFARVPFSDIGPIKVPDSLQDEQVLFLSDIFPTGWMAAENAEIEPGDTVAVWGAGPVGLAAAYSAQLLGAAVVIVGDMVPERLEQEHLGGCARIPVPEEARADAHRLRVCWP